MTGRRVAVALAASLVLAGVFAGVAQAAPGGELGRNPGQVLPPGAIEVADDVFLIGTADYHGQQVAGLAFIHRRSPAKPPGTPGNGPGGTSNGSDTSSCYAFIAKGAVWKSFGEPFVVDSDAVPASGSASQVRDQVGTAIGAWETAAGTNLLGSGSLDSGAVVNLDSTDDQNVVTFDDLGSGGTIAVTYTWGIYGGPPNSRRLVEWDQIYNTHYAWSFDGTPTNSEMDFANIATHETGHSLGMDHPDISCSEETMHRYASPGETKKRTLEAGDITGIRQLYA